MMRAVYDLFRRAVRSYIQDDASQQAAAVSYYVLFSLVPLVILLVSVFGFVVRDADVQQEVVDRVVEQAPLEGKDGEQLVTDTIRGVGRVSGGLSVLGLAGMLWSSLAMFGAIRKALNVIWDSETRRPFLRQKLVDLAMAAGFGLLVAASMAGTTALRILREVSNDALGPLSTGTGPLWSLAPFILPAALTFLVFLLLYRYVPNVKQRWQDVWPGALLATVLFEALKNGFAFYVANFNNYDVVYGSLGAVLLFLLFTYLSANILLFAGELAAEYPRWRRETWGLRPAEARPAGGGLRRRLRIARRP